MKDVVEIRFSFSEISHEIRQKCNRKKTSKKRIQGKCPVKLLSILTCWADACTTINGIWIVIECCVEYIDFYHANERLNSRGKRALLLIKMPLRISLIIFASHVEYSLGRMCNRFHISWSKTKKYFAAKRMVYWIFLYVYIIYTCSVFAHSDYVLVTASAICIVLWFWFVLFCSRKFIWLYL